MAATQTKGLEDLFLDGLKDIYYAEKKIVKALPKMAKGAESEELVAAFREASRRNRDADRAAGRGVSTAW